MRFVAFPATEYDEVLSGYHPVKWLSGEQINVSKTISDLVLRVLVLADSPRKLHHRLKSLGARSGLQAACGSNLPMHLLLSSFRHCGGVGMRVVMEETDAFD
jgi:hypothetical protein